MEEKLINAFLDRENIFAVVGAWFGIMCCSAEGAIMIGRGLWFLYGNSSVTSENCG